jgi:hypothetical protein
VSGQLHTLAALPPGERAPGTHWIGGWVDPRAGSDDMEKGRFLTLLGLELRPLSPAHSQSLYRLRNSGSYQSRYDRENEGSVIMLNAGIRMRLVSCNSVP